MSTPAPVSTNLNVAISASSINITNQTCGGTLTLPNGNNSNFSMSGNTLQVSVPEGTPVLVSLLLPVTTVTVGGGAFKPTTYTYTFSFSGITFTKNGQIGAQNTYLNSTDSPVTTTLGGWSVTVPAYSISALDANTAPPPNGGSANVFNYTIVFAATWTNNWGQTGSSTLNFDPSIYNQNY